jgi:beta-mannosidase
MVLAAIVLLEAGTRSALAVNASHTELSLVTGWRVTQDVRHFGERQGWFKPEFEDDWQPIDRLVHLQLMLAKQPYFGRELRYFNDSAWWYRLEFSTKDISSKATLRFEGVDYFAKVWLNGTLLGEHEGYADPFEFEVGSLLRKDGPNILVVKVTSPWDQRYRDLSDRDRQYPLVSVERNLLKGSYEHADTFVQRDVNPIGIWRPVELVLHDELRTSDPPAVTTSLSNDQKTADIKVVWSVVNDGPPRDVSYAVHVRAPNNRKDVATATRTVKLVPGANRLEASVVVPSPQLWTTWDRGGQPLYEASLVLVQSRHMKRDSSLTASRCISVVRPIGPTCIYPT